jgi:hypothetical protein
MEVIVVTRTYNNYEDSYTKTLGVVTSDNQANELIEKDKHKDDALGMTVTEYNNQLYAINERFNKLAINEESCPKKAGWLYRYDYNQLTKQQKIAYDIIKAGWEELGKPAFRYFKEEFTYNSDYRYYMQILLGFRRNTIEEVKNMSRAFHNCEDPDHITYRKEKFIVDVDKIDLKFIKDRVQPQSRPAWGEEDEKLFNRICDLIHEAAYENCETNEDGKELGEYAKMMRLLKFLKDCIQPKQEWSEEDEWKFSDILALLRGGENCHYNTPELFDWLKSLKELLKQSCITTVRVKRQYGRNDI